MKRLRRHKNILYTVVIILLALQIVTFVVLSSRVSKLNAELEDTTENITVSFTGLLDDYSITTQQNFNEIARVLYEQAQQQKSFEEEIRDIKSEQRDFSDVIEDSIKGVVSVGTEKSVGSGFIVNESGYIVTNRHVIFGAKQIRILTFDRNIIPAFIVGEDAFRDIALLKVSGIYSPLELADSDEQKVGDKVIAIGNPLGLSFSVTEGIISAVHRAGPNGLNEYIQTDVSLNPGNSGGPLINTDGEVVGINNFKIGGAEGLGFALESNSMKSLINDLADKIIV